MYPVLFRLNKPVYEEIIFLIFFLKKGGGGGEGRKYPNDYRGSKTLAWKKDAIDAKVLNDTFTLTIAYQSPKPELMS